ncbi:MAG: hypothetical protein U9N53_10275 [Bacteroidota bacterium]|nr:hypothetical protein [Bacteroidota bacterium]
MTRTRLFGHPLPHSDKGGLCGKASEWGEVVDEQTGILYSI